MITPHFFICSKELITIWNKHDLFFSKRFCDFFSKNLDELFLRETGLKPSSKVSLSAIRLDRIKPMYEPGVISRINTHISILPEFTYPISFCWKSETGKIVHTYEEEFDEDDLKCWIEGLKPKLYWEQLNSKMAAHPFHIKDSPFQIIVYSFGTHMSLLIKIANMSNSQDIVDILGETVEKHNNLSEAKNRQLGVVHNYHAEISDQSILFRIDTGSAGILIIKKLLRKLTAFEDISKVIIDL